MIGRCVGMFFVLLFAGLLVGLWVFATPYDVFSWVVAILLTLGVGYAIGEALQEIFYGLGE